MAIKDYSTTPADNTSVSGIFCGPSMARSDVDNLFRQVLADIKSEFLSAPSVEVAGGGDMSSDPTAAIQAAIASGKSFSLPAGTYNITSTLGKTAVGQCIYGAGRGLTILKKQFDGDMIELAVSSSLSHLKLDGNGSNYTGRGVVITDGSFSGTGSGFQQLTDVSIRDMYSYCVEWTTTASGWGGGMTNCEVQRTGNTTYCLKMPSSEANGNRILINVYAGSGPLIDFDGAANIQLIGCSSGSGGGASPAWTMTTACAKIQIIGGRYAVGGGTTSLLGQNHSVVGISHAGPFILGDGTANSLANSKGAGNDFAGYAVTANANASGSSANKFDIPRATYAPTWTAATSNPAIGDGELAGNYCREGETVMYEFELTIGSTTTFGSGLYSFSLPLKNNARVAIGQAWMFDSSSGTPVFVGLARADRNATTLQIYPNQTATGMASTVPFTWASGDKLNVAITYIGA